MGRIDQPTGLPLNYYCRSARLCWKKASFSKKEGYETDELEQLRQFEDIVTSLIRTHPQYNAKRQDKGIVEIEFNMIYAKKRIKELQEAEECSPSTKNGSGKEVQEDDGKLEQHGDQDEEENLQHDDVEQHEETDTFTSNHKTEALSKGKKAVPKLSLTKLMPCKSPRGLLQDFKLKKKVKSWNYRNKSGNLKGSNSQNVNGAQKAKVWERWARKLSTMPGSPKSHSSVWKLSAGPGSPESQSPEPYTLRTWERWVQGLRSSYSCRGIPARNDCATPNEAYTVKGAQGDESAVVEKEFTALENEFICSDDTTRLASDDPNHDDAQLYKDMNDNNGINESHFEGILKGPISSFSDVPHKHHQRAEEMSVESWMPLEEQGLGVMRTQSRQSGQYQEDRAPSPYQDPVSRQLHDISTSPTCHNELSDKQFSRLKRPKKLVKERDHSEEPVSTPKQFAKSWQRGSHHVSRGVRPSNDSTCPSNGQEVAMGSPPQGAGKVELSAGDARGTLDQKVSNLHAIMMDLKDTVKGLKVHIEQDGRKWNNKIDGFERRITSLKEEMDGNLSTFKKMVQDEVRSNINELVKQKLADNKESQINTLKNQVDKHLQETSSRVEDCKQQITSFIAENKKMFGAGSIRTLKKDLKDDFDDALLKNIGHIQKEFNSKYLLLKSEMEETKQREQAQIASIVKSVLKETLPENLGMLVTNFQAELKQMNKKIQLSGIETAAKDGRNVNYKSGKDDLAKLTKKIHSLREESMRTAMQVESLQKHCHSEFNSLKEKTMGKDVKAEIEHLKELKNGVKVERESIQKLLSKMKEIDRNRDSDIKWLKGMVGKNLRKDSNVPDSEPHIEMLIMEEMENLSQLCFDQLEEVKGDIMTLKDGCKREHEKFEMLIKRKQIKSPVNEEITTYTKLSSLSTPEIDKMVATIEKASKKILSLDMHEIDKVMAVIEKARLLETEAASKVANAASEASQVVKDLVEYFRSDMLKAVRKSDEFQENLAAERKTIQHTLNEVRKIVMDLNYEKESAIAAVFEARRNSIELQDCLNQDIAKVKEASTKLKYEQGEMLKTIHQLEQRVIMDCDMVDDLQENKVGLAIEGKKKRTKGIRKAEPVAKNAKRKTKVSIF